MTTPDNAPGTTPGSMPDNVPGTVPGDAPGSPSGSTLGNALDNAPGLREIPYNYTSFSDREIVVRFLGAEMWACLNQLRGVRRTGRSARMLFEVLGDLWIVSRNPLLQEALHQDPQRLDHVRSAMEKRLARIRERADGKTRSQVLGLVEATHAAVQRFVETFRKGPAMRARLLRQLTPFTRRDNLDFSAMARVAHMTDATDWRVACPLLAITPDSEEEIGPLVSACMASGLTIIPRGGGTGYTGSGVPLHQDTVVFNLERLNAIGPVIREDTLPGVAQPVPTIRVEAGAVTQHVAQAAEAADHIFAVDPTSQSASTVGGNIAMNAGGKKAVLWGTTLDNLVSWRMLVPVAQHLREPDRDCRADLHWLEVTRLDHSLGKIHDRPVARFELRRFQLDGRTPVGDPETLEIPADQLRKPGLGKDVTNKVLGGLPGVQKEGCDGLITRAVFLLHPKPAHTYTVCLEFFGTDLGQAVPAIVEIKHYLDDHPGVGCAGLEHLDERYIRAIGYNAKAARQARPKMVLLADIIGEDATVLEAAAGHVTGLAQARGGEGFVARTPEGRTRFWSDRTRTAAIAAHTNAFKINEDVVIPLEQLAAYSEGIERINIEQSLGNKLCIVQEMLAFLDSKGFWELLSAGASVAHGVEGDAILTEKRLAAKRLLNRVHHRWQTLLDAPTKAVASPDLPLTPEERRSARPEETLMGFMLRRGLRISYRVEVEKPLKNLFGGDLWAGVRQRLDALHGTRRSSRLFVALHMHAGDGNVHTNIPVNSNDYAMLREADRLVARIMALALRLGGCISGEHGIGLTKVQFLDPETITAFARYKAQVDPDDCFNRGKLQAGSGLEQAYTPSLRLVQKEALILRESALEALNNDIRHCLRCGKCKGVCTTHVPRANLLYAPRNKILAMGLVIEAFLYNEQTHRTLTRRHLEALLDVADHCTVCHRCLTPCPVDIDFGWVTVRIREMLKARDAPLFAWPEGHVGKRLALSFLTTTDPKTLRMVRRTVIPWGYAAQRLGCRIRQGVPRLTHTTETPEATGGPPSLWKHLDYLTQKPLPELAFPVTTRAFLGLEESDAIPIVQGSTGSEAAETVFYFPGCGCERLFGEIALATLAMLRHVGVQTVLPPGYLCCGFPQAAAGEEAISRRMVTGNRVLFHRMADALSDMEIQTVLVSCGTCLDQLQTYAFEQIFPGCRLMDIHEFLMEKGVRTASESGEESFLFHDPCHSPMKHHDPLQVATTLLGGTGQRTDRCCGEAGLFALSRPDIAAQVRFRKGMELPSQGENAQPLKLLTTCPSCFQGLSRQREDAPVETRFMVVELADRVLGKGWREALRGGRVERVLL